MRVKVIIDKVLEYVLIVLLAVMLLAVVWQVVSRYLIQSPSTVTDELSSFALIWLGVLGAAYVTGQKLHLAIDLIPEQALKKNRRLYEFIVHASIFVFALLVMVVGGSRLCQLTFEFNQTSASLEIPLGLIYSIVPVSGLVICYYSIYMFAATKWLKSDER